MLSMIVWINVSKYGLSGILLFLDSLVYWGVAKAFALFYALAGVSADVITQDTYQAIANKFYVIIGVVMLFYISYSLLKSLINPDDFNKNMGKIASNLIVSLILLGIVPLIFSYAFELQGAILDNHIIEQVVTGVSGISVGENDSNRVQGNKASYLMLRSFLNKEEKNISGEETMTWYYFMSEVENGNTDVFLDITDFAEVVHEGDMSYLSVFSTICGVFLLYVIISFSIDLGIRIAKLAFYEIIAPIPILMRILPEKKSVFDNWVKGAIATFMEVFIRIFIMSIIVFFASVVLNKTNLFDSNIGLIGNVIIVLGLFAFAKQAPKLLGDVMGIDSGNIKLGIGGKLKGSGVAGATVLGAAGALTGGLGGAWSGMVNHSGIGKSFAYGALRGVKGKGNQFNKQRQSVYNDVLGQKGDAGWFGGQGLAYRLRDTSKKNVQDAYEESSKHYVEKVNKSNKYKNIYDKIKADNEKLYSDLLEQFRKETEEFEREKMERIRAYQEQYAREEQKFNQDNLNKIMNLQNAINTAEKAKDITRVNTLTSQLQGLQNAKFEDSEMAQVLTNQMNQLTNSRYENKDLQAEMAKIPHTEEAYALAVEKALAKEDRRYKANREYVQTRAAEKAAKEWREANPTEAAINQEMLNKMFDNYTKEHGGGAPTAPTTPSAGSGGSSSSSSGGKK